MSVSKLKCILCALTYIQGRTNTKGPRKRTNTSICLYKNGTEVTRRHFDLSPPLQMNIPLLCCSPYFCRTDDSNQPQILTFGQRLCTNFLKVSYRQICNFIRAFSPASSPFPTVVHTHMCGINTLYIPTLASGQMWSMTRSKVAHYLAKSILAATETRACTAGWMLLDNSEGGAIREGRIMVRREGRFTLMHGLRKFDLNDDNQLIYTTVHRGCMSSLWGGGSGW